MDDTDLLHEGLDINQHANDKCTTIESCVVNQCCMNKSQLSYDVFV